ncbi:MAG TPA: hypothetical protein VJ883_11215, partial [Woeseiaceae bacterium]|nr:hypothetical protein [Woeseiaceae bacterium]
MSARNEQMLDLLVAKATEGLAPEEQRELERLLAASEEAEPEGIELAAAAAANAFALGSGYGEEMPAGLKERLLADAREDVGRGDAPRASASVTDIGSRARGGKEPRENGGNGPASSTFNRLGWAAAAMLLVALLVVNRPLPEEPGGALDEPAEARAELIRQEPGTLVMPWSPPDVPEYAGVTGDVVWNNEKQEGY